MSQFNMIRNRHFPSRKTMSKRVWLYQKLTVVSCALLLSMSVDSALAKKPNPNVGANSADFSITSNPDKTISIGISMEAGDQSDVNADWWLAIGTSAGWFYYDYDTGKWLYSGMEQTTIQPSYQGALVDFDTIEIDSVTGLPIGQYILYFAVDMEMDGDRAGDEIYEDTVFVNVSEGSNIAVVGGVTILDMSAESGEVKLTLSALDSINLGKATIQVFERLEDTGEERLLVDNQHAKKINQTPPIKLAMVLDRSGSFNNNEENLMEEGVLQMLDLLRNGDQVEVINVATDFYIDTSFRDFNAAPVRGAIVEPSITRGWTRIYDGIIQGIEDAVSHSTNVRNQNAILVITDGEDNRSDNSLDNVIAVSKTNNTPVFIVGLADESDPSDLDVAGLTRLAQETGGRFVETISPDFFATILGALARSLTTQYSVSYSSPFASGERTILLKVQDGDTIHTYERVFTP